MKKLLLLILLAPVLVVGQGEQRYADGTDTDQDGNTFEWINYGTQDWAIENAEVVTSRDGTPIPQVTDGTAWKYLSTGAWCYYDNDPSKGRLYNWYAFAGIHDNDENTPNKEFAPEGWHVPTDAEWTMLENELIANGYNYDGTRTGNKIAKALTSTTGWASADNITGEIGTDQSLNNYSGFNVFPVGYREAGRGRFYVEGWSAIIWSSTVSYNHNLYSRVLDANGSNLNRYISAPKRSGFSVHFVRDASTATTKDYSDAITIYPNPTSSIINIEQDFTTAKVYDISGRELLKSTSKTIDLSELPSNIYLLRLYDNNNRVLGTGKIIKN